MRGPIAYIIVSIFIASCDVSLRDENKITATPDDSIPCPVPVASFADDSATIDTLIQKTINGIDTRNVKPADVVAFAHTLKGVPYKYASTDPAKGFDCSGFITYVFNHFDIRVPRSSVDFTNEGREVAPAEAVPGDLILFTGTDSTIPAVGHMGIVTDNQEGDLSFIHSTSGKAYGVTVTPFNQYYKTRFVKVIRIFPQQSIEYKN